MILKRVTMAVVLCSFAAPVFAGCNDSVLSLGGLKIGSVGGTGCRHRVEVSSTGSTRDQFKHKGDAGSISIKRRNDKIEANFSSSKFCSSGSRKRCHKVKVSDRGVSFSF